jgi:predicted MFS family arabinose efflux permease
MGNEATGEKKSFRGLLLFLTLLLGVFLVYAGIGFLTTLYVDIAATFRVSIGTATTLSLISAGLGLIMGLALSFISLRFKHKYLFVSGIAFCAVGILIFFFAPNFAAAELSYFFTGMGAPMVMIMNITLIGELFPLEKRGWLVGLTVSTSYAVYMLYVILGVLGAIGVPVLLLLAKDPTKTASTQ